MKRKKKSSQHLIKPVDLTKNVHQIREQNILNNNKGMQRAKSKLWKIYRINYLVSLINQLKNKTKQSKN